MRKDVDKKLGMFQSFSFIDVFQWFSANYAFTFLKNIKAPSENGAFWELKILHSDNLNKDVFSSFYQLIVIGTRKEYFLFVAAENGYSILSVNN